MFNHVSLVVPFEMAMFHVFHRFFHVSVDPHRSPSAPFSAQLRRPAVHRRRPAPPRRASHRRIGGPVDGIG